MKAVWSLLRIVLIVAVLFVLIRIQTWLGLAGLAVYIAWWVFSHLSGLYAYWGNILYQQGKLQEAVRYMEKAAATRGCKPSTLIGCSFMLLKLGRLDESEAMLKRARGMSLSRDEQMGLDSNESLLLWKQGRLAEATALLERVNQDFKTTNTYITLGYFYILSGDLDKALAFNREGYEYNSSSPVILDNLAQTLYLKGELQESLALYEKLTADKPTFPEAYYNYALVLEALGRKKEALVQARQALEHPLSLLSTVTREEMDQLIARLEEAAASSGEA